MGIHSQLEATTVSLWTSQDVKLLFGSNEKKKIAVFNTRRKQFMELTEDDLVNL